MVADQIERRDISHQATLHAMRQVPRHEFIPQSLQSVAYSDRPLPIGFGQTISQPYIVAYMTALIQPKSHHKILEIGTGSGYQAAVLAEIVDSVFTIEIVKELEHSAQQRLMKLGYRNSRVRHSDGYFGWEEHAPFDAIVVTAASEFIPPPLITQLKNGGKMIIPVGSSFSVQHLVLVSKEGEKVKTKTLLPVRFVPFTRL